VFADILSTDAPLLTEFLVKIRPLLTTRLQPLLLGVSTAIALSYVRPGDDEPLRFTFEFPTVPDATNVLNVLTSLNNVSRYKMAPLRLLGKALTTAALDCYGDNQRHSGAASAVGGTNPLMASPLVLATVETMRVSTVSYGSLVKIAGSALRKAAARLLGARLSEWLFETIRARRLAVGQGYVRVAQPAGEMTDVRAHRLAVFEHFVAAPFGVSLDCWQYNVLRTVEHYGGLVYPTIPFIDEFSGAVGKMFVDWSARLVAAKIDAGLHYKYMLDAFRSTTLRDTVKALFISCARRSNTLVSVSDEVLKQICDSFVRPYFYTIALDLSNRRMARHVDEVVQRVIGRAIVSVAPSARAAAADKASKKASKKAKSKK
jgi:hypothetical protein